MPDRVIEWSRLCVLGCVDRRRSDVWPRPPRPAVDGLLTCRACADRLLTDLDQVLELAAMLELVVATGSVPAEAGQSRGRVKDEPVAPTPVRVPVTALTDPRSRRGGSVPAAGSVDRAVDPHDGEAVSVIGFLDHWTDQVRLGRQLDPGLCAATVLRSVDLRTGPIGGVQTWPRHEPCGLETHFARRVLPDAGARTTGLLVVCAAGHVTLASGQGDQEVARRGAHGHRATAGTRYGQTILTAVRLLRRHNEWLCTQPMVTNYARQLRALRRALGHAHGEPQPMRIGSCPARTGAVLSGHDSRWHACLGDACDQQVEVDEVCAAPLFAQAYSDSIECGKCGTTWTARDWRQLGRLVGVL